MLRKFFIAAIFAAIPLTVIQAETVTKWGVTAGYTDNLFADSSVIDDSYTRAEGGLEYYPTYPVALELAGSYTAFGRTADLNYLDFSGSGSYLIGNPSSRVTPYLTVGAAWRSYGQLYSEYNRMTSEATLGMRTSLGPVTQFRVGAGFSGADYPNASTGDFQRLIGMTGLNTSLPSSNSLDIEASVAQTWLADPSADIVTVVRNSSWSQRLTADLTSLHYRVRWSRPVGPRVGLSVSLAGRNYLGENQPILPGYSLDNLSPWSDFYEGYTVGLDLKTFFIPHSIVSMGGAFRQADFIDALESDETGADYYLSARSDDRASAYLNFQRPIKLSGGGLVTPIFEIGYVDNASTLARYEYSSVSASFRVTVTP